MNTKNIAIVGGGQLGSRHLQALKSVDADLRISVSDPSNESLNICKERFDSIPANKFVQNIKYLDKLPENTDIDIAIIATSSNVRSHVIKNLIYRNNVKNLIIEKLLFQKFDYT